MPPFAAVECPHCGHRNRYDLAELKKKDGHINKGIVYRSAEQVEEFEVTCDNCGRSFKLTLKGEQNATKK